MLFDNLCWQVLLFLNPYIQISTVFQTFEVYEIQKTFTFSKPSEGYSFLFEALHNF
jgi:hypothetical protein